MPSSPLPRLAAVALATAALLGGLVATPASAAPPAAGTTPAAAPAAAAPAAAPTDLSGDTVPVPQRTRARGEATADAAPGDVTVERVYVTTVAATASTADDTVTGLDDASVQRAVADLRAFWAEESGGRVDVQLAAVEQRSLGRDACDPTAVFQAVRGVAHGGRFASFAWAGTNDHLLVLTREACGTRAFGTVGGAGGEIFSSYGLGQQLGVPVLLHEFGHNLGFGHAGSAMCRSTTVADGAASDYRTAADASSSSASCPVEEYGDFSDIMGYSIPGARPHLSAPQRVLAGWLPDATELRARTPGQRVVLSALDGRTGPRAVTVVDPLTGTRYVVEYRTAAGRDATSTELGRRQPRCSSVGAGFTKCALTSDPATGGVRVLRTLGTPGSPQSTVVLAAGPVAGQPATTRDTHLDAGERFTSAGGGVTVSVRSLSPTGGAVLDVALGTTPPPSTTATTTRLTVDRTRQTHRGAAATATTVVATASGAAPRGTITLRDGSTVLAQGRPDATGTLRTVLPTTLAAGRHALTASFTPDDATQAASTSASTTVTVDRAATTTTLRRAAATQVHGGAGTTLTATVSPVAGTVPAGSVRFTRNGTAVATVAVSRGTASWTLPSGTPAGTQRLVATFTPSDPSFLGSTSTTQTVTVRKATSTTTVAPVRATVARGTAPSVRVTVASAALPRPTGRLTVTVNGRTVATPTLRSADRGRLTVVLPKQSKRGTVTVAVSWAGTADVAGSTSSRARVTVR
ncbi:Ig-like domain repeat protein [Frigoribacterium salinisoli]